MESQSNSASYPEELLQLIRKTTRTVQFNFEEVANIVNQSSVYHEYIRTTSSSRNEQKITAQQCREIFAKDYNSIISSSQDHPTGRINKKDDLNKNEEINEKEPQSLNDVLESHERMRKENDRKIDQIFKRVLGVLETTEKVSLNENDEVVMAHRQRIENRENERQRKILIEEQQREIEAFEVQRAKLKKRFDADSEDAEGIDPLAQRVEGS